MTELIPERYRGDEEIIRLTIEQIRKDFGTLLPPLHFSGSKEKLFEELAFQLTVALQSIFDLHPTRFKSLLYRIDIAERDAKQSLARNSFHLLSEKIIQREFQKVLTRRFFSGDQE